MSEARLLSLPAGYEEELSSAWFEPVYLVCFHFPGDPFYVSSQRQVVIDGIEYRAHGVELGKAIEFLDHTTTDVTLYLTNENNLASALILNYGLRGVEVTIREVQFREDGTHTPPVLLFKGECGSVRLRPEYAEISLKKPRARTRFAPDITFSPANGFNHLPQAGEVVVINGEKYQLGE